MAFNYKIIKHIATLSETQDESKQVNIISYNNSKPKVDIRNWFDDGKMGKGIVLDDEEWLTLGKCFTEPIDDYDLEGDLNQVSWLTKKCPSTYIINLADFGIDVDCDAELIIDDSQEALSYSISVITDKSKVQKHIEFLNNANKYFSENSIHANAYIDFDNDVEQIKIVGRIPVNFGDVEENLDLVDEFLSEFSNSINEIGNVESKQLYIDNVIVIGDFYSCVHDKHKSEEVFISIYFVKKDGTKVRVDTKAFYCNKCNLFFMRKYDYLRMKVRVGDARMLCQEIEHERYLKNPDFSEYDLNDHSILNVYGYNVNSQDNLSNEQRREILASLVDRGILSRNRIAGFLAYLIKLNSNKKKDMQNAMNKWEADRNFILDYKVDSRRKVEPEKISIIKYIPLK